MLNQPTSSPMMTRMFGGRCCCCASACVPAAVIATKPASRPRHIRRVLMSTPPRLGNQLLLCATPLTQTCLAVTVKTQSGPVVLCRAEEDFEQRNAVAGVKSRLIRRDQFVAISISIYRIGPSSAAKAASGPNPASSAGPRTGTTPHIRYVAGSAGGYSEDDTTMIRE